MVFFSVIQLMLRQITRHEFIVYDLILRHVVTLHQKEKHILSKQGRPDLTTPMSLFLILWYKKELHWEYNRREKREKSFLNNKMLPRRNPRACIYTSGCLECKIQRTKDSVLYKRLPHGEILWWGWKRLLVTCLGFISIVRIVANLCTFASILYIPLSPFDPMGPLIPAGPGKPAAPVGPLSPGGPEHTTTYTTSLIEWINSIWISRCYLVVSYPPSPCLPSAPWGPSQVDSTHRS